MKTFFHRKLQKIQTEQGNKLVHETNIHVLKILGIVMIRHISLDSKRDVKILSGRLVLRFLIFLMYKFFLKKHKISIFSLIGKIVGDFALPASISQIFP